MGFFVHFIKVWQIGPQKRSDEVTRWSEQNDPKQSIVTCKNATHLGGEKLAIIPLAGSDDKASLGRKRGETVTTVKVVRLPNADRKDGDGGR